VEPVAASPSCPRCGAEVRAGAGQCTRCGFALLDAPGGRRVRLGGRPRTAARVGRRTRALAAAALAAAVLAVAGRDDRAPDSAAPLAGRPAAGSAPAARPDARSPGGASAPLPAPLSTVKAERQLELRFAKASDDESAAVRCPRPIGPERMVRCELRYATSAARPLLVRLSPRGELEAVVPAAVTLKR
jgi:zinc ribbon protein